jgi:hypothetical protein
MGEITTRQRQDLTSERVLGFLRTIESSRGNKVHTRNQRLAAIHTFYRYLAVRHPDMLAEAERVEAIPPSALRLRTHFTWNAKRSTRSSRRCHEMVRAIRPQWRETPVGRRGEQDPSPLTV